MELVLFFLILITYVFAYTADVGASIALFIFYALLFLGSLQTFFKYDTNTNERRLQKKLLLLSMIHMLLQVLIKILYLVVIGGRGKLSLGSIKAVTWIWFFAVFIDVAILLCQLFVRIYTSFHVPDFVEAKRQFEENYKRVETANKQIQDNSGQQVSSTRKDEAGQKRVLRQNDPEAEVMLNPTRKTN